MKKLTTLAIIASIFAFTACDPAQEVLKKKAPEFCDQDGYTVVNYCPQGYPLEGTWVCGHCRSQGASTLRVSAETLTLLQKLQEWRWDVGHGETSASVRRQAGRVLHRLLTCHLERYRYPRALQLLKKVNDS